MMRDHLFMLFYAIVTLLCMMFAVQNASGIVHDVTEYDYAGGGGTNPGQIAPCDSAYGDPPRTCYTDQFRANPPLTDPFWKYWCVTNNTTVTSTAPLPGHPYGEHYFESNAGSTSRARRSARPNDIQKGLRPQRPGDNSIHVRFMARFDPRWMNCRKTDGGQHYFRIGDRRSTPFKARYQRATGQPYTYGPQFPFNCVDGGYVEPSRFRDTPTSPTCQQKSGGPPCTHIGEVAGKACYPWQCEYTCPQSDACEPAGATIGCDSVASYLRFPGTIEFELTGTFAGCPGASTPAPPTIAGGTCFARGFDIQAGSRREYVAPCDSCWYDPSVYCDAGRRRAAPRKTYCDLPGGLLPGTSTNAYQLPFGVSIDTCYGGDGGYPPCAPVVEVEGPSYYPPVRGVGVDPENPVGVLYGWPNDDPPTYTQVDVFVAYNPSISSGVNATMLLEYSRWVFIDSTTGFPSTTDSIWATWDTTLTWTVKTVDGEDDFKLWKGITDISLGDEFSFGNVDGRGRERGYLDYFWVYDWDYVEPIDSPQKEEDGPQKSAPTNTNPATQKYGAVIDRRWNVPRLIYR